MRCTRSSVASSSLRIELFLVVSRTGDIFEIVTYLSVLSFTMMVSAPKNLTFSSGRSRRLRAKDQASEVVWSLERIDCVFTMTSGVFGW